MEPLLVYDPVTGTTQPSNVLGNMLSALEEVIEVVSLNFC